MARLAGLGLVFAATAAAAEPPLVSQWALREIIVAPPAPNRELHFGLDVSKTDYSEPARPSHKRGFLAAVQVAPNALLGVGMSDRKTKRSSLGPDADRDGRRGGKTLALRFSLGF
jgi:hypothetical protein